jgi:hypothetical protein
MSSGDLPLGSTLVVPVPTGLARELPAELRDRHFQPWCACCLVLTDPRVEPELMAALHHGRRQVARLVPRHGAAPDAAGVRTAVRQRDLPNHFTLVAYVTRRGAAEADIRDALEYCLNTDANGDGLSRSALSRRLHGFGRWTARDWRTLARLIRILHYAEGSMDAVGWQAGMDPRTLREQCARYLDATPSQALGLPGWEWKLEAALRKGDLVSGQPLAVERSSDDHQLV